MAESRHSLTDYFNQNLIKISQGALRVIISANIAGYILAKRSLRQNQVNILTNIQELADQRAPGIRIPFSPPTCAWRIGSYAGIGSWYIPRQHDNQSKFTKLPQRRFIFSPNLAGTFPLIEEWIRWLL